MPTPMTALHFTVSWGDSRNTSAFSEVSGLTGEIEVIEYRAGNDLALTVQKIPGNRKFGPVTAKRGVMPSENGNGLFEWFSTLRAGNIDRRPVVISLMNERQEPVMVWQLRQAFPTKIDGPALNAKGTEVAIETLEFAHEGFEITVLGG